jgi:hypothetical protein
MLALIILVVGVWLGYTFHNEISEFLNGNKNG